MFKRSVCLTTLAVACLTAGPLAAKEAQVAPPTTHELAACRQAPDLALCLLTIAARDDAAHESAVGKPVDLPLSFDAAFMDAPEVVAAAMQGLPAPRKARLDGDRARSAALAATLRADRAGSPPDAALAAGETLAVSGIKDPAVRTAVLRHFYADVWMRWKRTAASDPHRPSEALVRAALARQEGVWPPKDEPRDEWRATDLADAWASLGDRESAARALRLDSHTEFEDYRVLLALGQYDEAASAFRALGHDWDLYEPKIPAAERARFSKALLAAGRADLVIAEAEATLDRPAGEWPFAAGITWALTTLVELAPEKAALRLEALDARARQTENIYMRRLAVPVVEGWAKLGRIDRAQALTRAWAAIPRGPAGGEYTSGVPNLAYLIRMQLSAGLLDDAYASFLEVKDGIGDDLEHGRGLSRLETHLAHAADDSAREVALHHCVRRAQQLKQIDQAVACARRMAALPSPSGGAGADRTVGLLLEGAWLLHGEPVRQREMVDLALTRLAALPDRPGFDNRIGWALRPLAADLLQAEGRL